MQFDLLDGDVYCLGIIWFIVHILLNQMMAFDFSFPFVFMQSYIQFVFMQSYIQFVCNQFHVFRIVCIYWMHKID
jgi:hypothetical protein